MFFASFLAFFSFVSPKCLHPLFLPSLVPQATVISVAAQNGIVATRVVEANRGALLLNSFLVADLQVRLTCFFL